MVWLLGNCGLGNVLAAPGTEASALEASVATTGPVAEGDTRGMKEKFQALSDRISQNPASFQSADSVVLCQAIQSKFSWDYNISDVIKRIFTTIGSNLDNFTDAQRSDALSILRAAVTTNSGLIIRYEAINVIESSLRKSAKKHRSDALSILGAAAKENSCWLARRKAIEALKNFFNNYKHDEEDERQQALSALITAIQDQEFVAPPQGLKDHLWDPSTTAINALEGIFGQLSANERKQAFDALIATIQNQKLIRSPRDTKDYTWNTSMAAIKALGRLFGQLIANEREQALNVLIEATKHQETTDASQNQGTGKTQKATEKAWPTRQAAVQAFGDLQELTHTEISLILKHLGEATTDPSEDVRKATSDTCRKLAKLPCFLEILFTTINDQDSSARQAAVQALGQALESLKEDDHRKALQALIDTSGAQGSNVCQAAVQALGQNLGSLKDDNHSKALQALIDTSGAQDSNVRQAVVKALTQLQAKQCGKALTFWIKATKSQDSGIRLEAVLGLQKHYWSLYNLAGNERSQVLAALINATEYEEAGEDKYWSVRKAAIQGLRLREDLTSKELSLMSKALIKATDDPNEDARKAAVQELGLLENLPSEELSLISEALIKAAGATNEEDVREAALGSLGNLKNLDSESLKLTLDILVLALKDESRTMYRAAQKAFRKIDITAPKILLNFIGDNDLQVFQAVFMAIGKFFKKFENEVDREKVLKILIETSKPSVTKAQEATEDPSEGIRTVAFGCLEQFFAQLKPEDEATKRAEILTVLLNSTTDSNWKIRKEAVWALGKLAVQPEVTDTERDTVLTILIGSNQEGATNTQGAIKDENKYVRKEAVWALGKIGAQLQDQKREEVVTALCAVADNDNEDEYVVCEAAEALESFGEEAPSTS